MVAKTIAATINCCNISVCNCYKYRQSCACHGRV